MTTGYSGGGGGGSLSGGYVEAFQKLFGGHGAGHARSASRAMQQIAFASLGALRDLAAAQQRQVQLMIGQSPLMPVQLYTAKQQRQLHHIQFRMDQARGVGDKTRPPKGNPKETRLQQERLAKLTSQAAVTGATVFASRYGINNPLLAGSRDDPRGVFKPNMRVTRGFHVKRRFFR